MSDTKFNIPESLIEALKSKRVVPFIGAGVSMSIKKFPLEALRDKDGNEQEDKLYNLRKPLYTRFQMKLKSKKLTVPSF